MARTLRASAPQKRRPRPAPVQVVQAHPLAWKTALRLAKGDVARLEIKPDGAVLVRNV